MVVWTSLVLFRVHTVSTGTHTMENLPDIFLKLEPTVPSMVCCPIPPNSFLIHPTSFHIILESCGPYMGAL